MWSLTVGMCIFQMEGDARLQWLTPLFPQTDLFAGQLQNLKQCDSVDCIDYTVLFLCLLSSPPVCFLHPFFPDLIAFALLLWLPALLNNRIPLFICHGNTLQIGSIPLATLLNMVLLKQHWITGSFQPKLWFVSIVCFCRHVFHWTVDWWCIGDDVKKKIPNLYLYRKHI